ncbi:MAG TPA: DALR domain-containing protein, partial [Gemmataceae bacterium]|nr:DALR domain-containing protein [Gemmataceae bacterium]
EVSRLRTTFLDDLADDFNTGGAIGVLYELVTALNRFADARQLEGPAPVAAALPEFERGVVVLRELSQILGLFREPPPAPKADDEKLSRGLAQLLADVGGATGAGPSVEALMQALIARRAEARKAKNFAVADQVRKRLGELGVTLEDRAGGTSWRVG